MKRRRSVDKEAKDRIHSRIDEMIEGTAEEVGLTPEEVAQETFYRMQRHPDPGLRRNATKAEQRASFEHWGECQRPGCTDELTIEEAVFHHLERGIPEQHSPSNLLPFHPGCHDAAHSVHEGSLSKGSPAKKRK